jgi:hypothetical protein
LTEAKMQVLLLDWLAFLGFSKFSCWEPDITITRTAGCN